jgi:sugar phosphate isomerase/epimerase
MRLTSPTFDAGDSPETWIDSLRRAGYTAGQPPVSPDASPEIAAAYANAARAAGVVIAEIGAWCNPISPDELTARRAIERCQRHLDLAERLGARSCVNIAGSRHPTQWDGPHPENFSGDTFDLIVQTTREIIDAVRPRRTFYTLETMPWIFPSSPDEYLALIDAIDRPGLAVHLDPVNMINSPARAYRTGDFIRECFTKLGRYIKNCHAKDIVLGGHLTVHLDECLPGSGALDYAVYLRELDKLDADTPLYIEHLPPEQYPAAAQNIRAIARANQIVLK